MSHSSMYTHALVYTRAHSCTLVYTHVHPCTLMYTQARVMATDGRHDVDVNEYSQRHITETSCQRTFTKLLQQFKWRTDLWRWLAIQLWQASHRLTVLLLLQC